ncbi:DUF2977 domain-containing protein [Anaerofustis stercorihominis]|uniref:DUF2977 domain-containing protein n=1 Tax=Anaerofustis stercorihominis TaxID=214853 RepID=UPI001484F3EB|nr:DUF2977 domain-containing protein [Anaerofustis stercorihominis]
MKISLDENKYIVAFATVGDVENSIETDLSVEDFNDLPCFVYKYENGILTLDEEKKKEWEDEQNEPEPEPEPTGDYVTYDELANAIKEGVNSYGI